MDKFLSNDFTNRNRGVMGSGRIYGFEINRFKFQNPQFTQLELIQSDICLRINKNNRYVSLSTDSRIFSNLILIAHLFFVRNLCAMRIRFKTSYESVVKRTNV